LANSLSSQGSFLDCRVRQSHILISSGPVTNTNDIWRTVKHDANVQACHKERWRIGAVQRCMWSYPSNFTCIRLMRQQISAAQLRQGTYSMTRFGVYETLKDRMTTADTKPSFLTLVGMASISGFLGGFAGNPGDILNVRMQHDAALPKEKRRGYKNAIDGIIRMSREEGVASLWKGVWPNSSRAVLMTVGQLATYDGFKRVLLNYTPLEDNLSTHFSASFLAGFVATTICSPVDVIKTKVMSSSESIGLVKTVTDTMRAEGFRWMFKGWVPSFIRVGPHTVLTFLFLEQHKKVYRQVKKLE
jgi:dicarboxylate transporter 10